MRYTLILCLILTRTFYGQVRHFDARANHLSTGSCSSEKSIISRAAHHARFGSVLFVEDNAGWGVFTHTDSLWLTVLTNILGSGNFGWFGPTNSPYSDGPDLATMQNYDLVIWNNYDHYDGPTLTENDQLNITDYINGGGKFWLIGQDVIYSGVPYYFLNTNFHLESYIQNYIFDAVSTHIQGLAEVAGNTFFITEDYVWGSLNPDALYPDTAAHHIVKDNDWTYYPGIISNDLRTSFWAIDGRTPNPFSTWQQLVHDMLSVFVGIEESDEPQVSLGQLKIVSTPSIFKNITTINYTVPVNERVTITIYAKNGARVRTLKDEHQVLGNYRLIWNGTYADGSKVANGVYFCRIICGKYSYTTKLVFVE